MRHWPILLLLTAFFLTVVQSSRAAAQNQTDSPPPDYTFGGQVTFTLLFSSDNPFTAVEVFVQGQGQTDTIIGLATIDQAQASYTLDLTDQPLRAFSWVEYWYRITPTNGDPYLTTPQIFFYEDNRFEWQMLEQAPFRVHWYDSDTALGQMVLNAARSGLERSHTLITSLAEPDLVNIYIYASGQELQSAMHLGGLSWVAGHADPDLSLIMVSLPNGPDQRSQAETRIPHELMHILMYQSIGEAYESLPTWFKEGLASANERTANPDYYTILIKATEKGTLIPLESLCQRFPQDANVYLAYAESDSFVRYLHTQYGAAGMRSLMDSYAQGLGCERGPLVALGSSLSQLEKMWRREALNEDVLLVALENISPWLILSGVLLLIPLLMMLAGPRRKQRVSQNGAT
ncbi:MAG: hypothetical protein JW726_18515 [Anaerolineales bacterium]|nr:hypothetical protein [Anaerolineales bacterium]